LIVHTLDAARASSTVTDILVSTDDAEIASVCEAAGMPVPYRRPPALAGDTAGMVDTVLHAADWWQSTRGNEPELIVLLQPTSPLRTATDIDGTVAALRDAGRESAVSVHPMREHPMECVRISGETWTKLAQAPNGALRRQDYDGRFCFINGAVYAVTPAFLRKHKAFVAEHGETVLYEMDAMRGIDIDNPEDLDLAEAILNHARLRQRVLPEAKRS
jgi:N-acylneuraminate cytidylyltransferase/CMP-N,N'-diacetyllegionaminic acid synthase